MSLAEVLKRTPNLIQFDFEGKTKETVIASVIEVLNNEGLLNDKHKYMEDVFKREEECSTGIGMEIAIPHARSIGVNSACFTIIKLKDPVEWESLDGNPVNIVIMLAVPEDETAEFLKLLSALSYNLMDDDFRNSIINATSRDEIIQLFDKINVTN